jgi:hypothetical protein
VGIVTLHSFFIYCDLVSAMESYVVSRTEIYSQSSFVSCTRPLDDIFLQKNPLDDLGIN